MVRSGIEALRLKSTPCRAEDSESTVSQAAVLRLKICSSTGESVVAWFVFPRQIRLHVLFAATKFLNWWIAYWSVAAWHTYVPSIAETSMMSWPLYIVARFPAVPGSAAAAVRVYSLYPSLGDGESELLGETELEGETDGETLDEGETDGLAEALTLDEGETDREGEGLFEGETELDGEAEREDELDALLETEEDGETDAEGEGETEGLTLELGETEAEGLTEGETLEDSGAAWSITRRGSVVVPAKSDDRKNICDQTRPVPCVGLPELFASSSSMAAKRDQPVLLMFAKPLALRAHEYSEPAVSVEKAMPVEKRVVPYFARAKSAATMAVVDVSFDSTMFAFQAELAPDWMSFESTVM